MAKKAEGEQAVAAEGEARVIKRYSNRKLYDTKDSRYVTLQQIGEMVRRGDHVRIVDNKTKEDKTEVTLALILSEELKTKPSSVPLGTLRTLIQERGERLLSQLREGPMGRFIPKADPSSPADPERPSDETPASPAETPERPPAEPSGSERPTNPAMARLYELVESTRQTFDELEATLEERIRELVPRTRLFKDMRSTVETLTQRVEELERRLGLGKARGEGKAEPKGKSESDKEGGAGSSA